MKKFNKVIAIAVSAFLMLGCFAGCGETPETEETNNENTASETNSESADPSTLENIAASDKFSNFDTTISYTKSECTVVTLADGASAAEGNGVTVEGDKITISAGGDYILSGTLTNGQIVVNAAKTEKVRLIFEGVNITNQTQSALYIMSADKVGITLASGTENNLTDGNVYTDLDENGLPSACIYSKDDLVINGYGSLNVKGNYDNGIVTKNDLKLVSGNITVDAVNNAIKGNDSILVNSGTITITGAEDGMKVTEDTDTSKGYICIEGGTLDITANDDGLVSAQTVTITGGTVTTHVADKAVNCDGTVNIAEGCLIEK